MTGFFISEDIGLSAHIEKMVKMIYTKDKS
ncbi:MAG: hypothetical protein ACJAS1_007376 [Oleiphilaceae bacterium]|jgi:hypothetical protein